MSMSDIFALITGANAVEIARYVIDIRNRSWKEVEISNAKLQFVMYLLQRDYIVQHKMPLYKNKIEAWNYGPCVPDVYFKYNMFGGLDIDSSCMTDYGREIEVPFQLKLFIIERVFHYIKLSFRELHELVTQEGGAYKTIVGVYGLKPRHEIPLDLIYMEAVHECKP